MKISEKTVSFLIVIQNTVNNIFSRKHSEVNFAKDFVSQHFYKIHFHKYLGDWKDWIVLKYMGMRVLHKTSHSKKYH